MINGDTGKLLYAGYDIVDLAEQSTFEEVCWLLWHGELPAKRELESLRRGFAGSLEPPATVWDAAAHAPEDADPMDLLRTQVSILGMSDPDRSDNGEEANRAKGNAPGGADRHVGCHQRADPPRCAAGRPCAGAEHRLELPSSSPR